MKAATLKTLEAVAAVIDMTNPEHPSYRESCADAVEALCFQEKAIREAIEAEHAPAEHNYTEAEEAQLGQAFASLLHLRRESGKPGWRTGWGWKTDMGLFRILRNIMHELDAGDTHAVCKLDKQEE